MGPWKMLLAVLLFRSCAVSQNRETPNLETNTAPMENPVADLKQLVEEMVAPFINKEEHVGLSVALIEGAEIAYFHFGEVEKGSGVTPNNQHIWEIGSISKTYTAVLVARYCELHDIGLETPVSEFLAEDCEPLIKDGKQLTLQHLLNHTSGLPRLPEDVFEEADEADPYAHYGREDILEYVCNFQLERVPGTYHEYSNLGFALLGILLERHSGKSYAELLEEYVLAPLGLKESYVELAAADQQSQIAPYLADGSPGSHWNMEAWAPTGAIQATMPDVARYAQAQLSGFGGELETTLATTKTVTFTENDNLAVGQAWFTISTPQFSWYFHNGGTGGFSSLLLVDPATNKGLVLISNNAFQEESEVLGFQLFKAFTEH